MHTSSSSASLKAPPLPPLSSRIHVDETMMLTTTSSCPPGNQGKGAFLFGGGNSVVSRSTWGHRLCTNQGYFFHTQSKQLADCEEKAFSGFDKEVYEIKITVCPFDCLEIRLMLWNFHETTWFLFSAFSLSLLKLIRLKKKRKKKASCNVVDEPGSTSVMKTCHWRLPP